MTTRGRRDGEARAAGGIEVKNEERRLDDSRGGEGGKGRRELTCREETAFRFHARPPELVVLFASELQGRRGCSGARRSWPWRFSGRRAWLQPWPSATGSCRGRRQCSRCLADSVWAAVRPFCLQEGCGEEVERGRREGTGQREYNGRRRGGREREGSREGKGGK